MFDQVSACYSGFTMLVIVDNDDDDNNNVAAGIFGGAETFCATNYFFF